MAALVVSAAAAGALATWRMTSGVPYKKRVTELGTYIAMHQIERIKAAKYGGLSDTGNTPIVDWYDKDGTWLGTDLTGLTGKATANFTLRATTGTYKAKTYVRTIVPDTATGTTRDLVELEVKVMSSDETTRYDGGDLSDGKSAFRTLLTFGGL